MRLSTPSGRPPRGESPLLLRALRWASWVPVLLVVMWFAAQYSRLPETVPTHFGIDGRPDAYGPKATLWLLVAVLVGVQASMHALAPRPDLFNYPCAVTDANAGRLYRAGEAMLTGMQISLSVMFAGIILTALDPSGRLAWLLWVGVGFVLATAAVGIGSMIVIGRSRQG